MNNIVSFVKEHLVILEVLVPFFGSLLTVVSRSQTVALWISRLCAVACIILAGYGIYVLYSNTFPLFYAIGNWPRPIGIEYRMDRFNQIIILLNNIILLTLLTLNYDLVRRSLIMPVSTSANHLLYSILLLLHTGFCGIVVSNDLFNIYVFIEIASLASYTLLAQGKDKRALIGSINYLIIGTIGATLILIAIGFIFSITGSLNINDISIRLTTQSTRTLTGGVIFYIIGCLLKLAIFPIGSWLLQAYRYTSSVTLSYFAPVSGIVSSYTLLYFVYHVIGIDHIQELKAYYIINIVCIAGAVICSYYAGRQNSIKSIMTYSIIAEISHISLIIFNIKDCSVGAQIAIALIASSITKSIIYSLISRIEIDHHDYHIEELRGLGIKYPAFGLLLLLSLISNLGLPISIGFVNKLNILSIALSSLGYLSLIAISISNCLSFIYHYKIFNCLYYSYPADNNNVKIIGNNYGALQLIIISYLLLIFYNLLATYLQEFFTWRIT